jgi:hypothetical protein
MHSVIHTFHRFIHRLAMAISVGNCGILLFSANRELSARIQIYTMYTILHTYTFYQNLWFAYKISGNCPQFPDIAYQRASPRMDLVA